MYVQIDPTKQIFAEDFYKIYHKLYFFNIIAYFVFQFKNISKTIIQCGEFKLVLYTPLKEMPPDLNHKYCISTEIQNFCFLRHYLIITFYWKNKSRLNK